MASPLPSSLGRYEIIDEIGRGAMGVVYLARDPLIGRLVALKTFRIGFSPRDRELQEFRTRFMREAQSAGILSHPNIVTVHDVVDLGERAGTFIAMEYVRGTNLKEILRGGEPLPLGDVSRIVSQIADALDYAHGKGVIHRDIKPANVILTADGQVKITDFGIARLNTSDLTQEGQLLGTPNYMAPERILGRDFDHRTDIFSLGVVLYEMLTRAKPFQGDNLSMVSHRIVYEGFAPPQHYAPEIPASVVTVLQRAMEKEPRDRYPTAGEMAAALELAAWEASAGALGAAAASLPEPGPGLDPPTVPELPPLPDASPAAEDPGAETQDMTPYAVAAGARGATETDPTLHLPPPVPLPSTSQAPPAAGGERPRRALVIAAAAAAAALLLAALAGLWVTLQQPPVERPRPEEVQRAQALPFLQVARGELDAGRPQAALRQVRRGLALAPDDPGLRALEGEIERQLTVERRLAAREQQVASLLAGARQALAEGRRQEAEQLARQALALDPERPDAEELVAAATAPEPPPPPTRSRSAALPEEGRRPSSEPEPPPFSSEAPAAAPPPPTASEPRDVTLRIDFLTELPEGVLTVYAGSQQILREPFRFYEKKGVFKTEPRAGRIEAARTVPAGGITLRIYAAPPGRAPEVAILDETLVEGSDPLLRIHLRADGSMTARVQ
ncbi:MAG TPA: protein kinase [Thermoanaerobaculia bacterium]|nr:protein kinase [Thermoanaerobaculia bacterium]